MTEPTKALVPPTGDFKADYRRLEDMAQLGTDTHVIVAEMEQIINQWKEGLLSAENEQLFLNTCFPKVVQKLTKCKIMADEHIQRVFKFFRVAMRLIIETIPRNIVGMADALQHIFNHDNNFYYTRVRPQDPWKLQEDELWANIPQSAWYCDLAMDAINFFGSNQGFLVLFEHVANENTPIPFASALMSAANQCLLGGYITRQKIPDYIAGALASLKRLHNLNVYELRRSKKEDFENIIKVANNILRYQLKQSEINERTESAYLEVAKQCISSTGIEKRLWGVNHLVQVVDALKQQENRRFDVYNTDDSRDKVSVKWITAAYLVDWLAGSGILEQLFGPNRHAQLLKPCAPILRFLAQHEKLSKDDISSVWICATATHESIAQITLQLISDVCAALMPSHVQQFLSKVKEIRRSELTPHLLNFISNMTKSTREPTLRLQFLELLWDMVVDESIPVDLNRTACAFVDEVVKLEALSTFRKDFIKKVMELLNKNDTKSKALSYRLLRSLLTTFPTAPSQTAETIGDVVKALGEENIVPKILTELKEFKTASFALYNPQITDPHTTVLAGRLPYGEELKARLEALSVILGYHSVSLNPDAVIELWDWLYLKTLSPGEKDEVVVWFTNSCSTAPNGFPPIDTASAARLFQERILKLSADSMTSPCFQCFSKYFLETNVCFNKIKWLHQGDFTILQEPGQLLGYQELWNIVLDGSNPSVVDHGIELLNKIHEKTSSALQEGKGKQLIRESYIGRCVKHLETAYQALTEAKAEAGGAAEAVKALVEKNKARIVRCVTILMKLVDATEPNASKQATITRGISIVFNVVVALDLPNVARYKFLIVSDTNSFWRPLRARICEKVKQHALTSTLSQLAIEEEDLVFLRTSRNSGSPIDGLDGAAAHNHTLGQLGFADKDTLVVRLKPSIKHRETTFRLRSKVAQQLDEKPPADAAEKASNIADMWGITKELATFALRKYGWDMNRVADIFVDDNKRAELTAEARKAGVSEDAEPIEVPSSEDDIAKAMESKLTALLDPKSAANVDSALPSAIITSDSSLDVLFKLLQMHDEQISELVWNFIVQVPASPYVKRQLLAPLLAQPAGDDKPNWSVLLPAEPYKLLYTLQLVDQVLFPFDDSQCTLQRAEWASWLLRTGGLTQLMNSFVALQIESHLSAAASLHLRDCLALVLKVLDCFFGFGRPRNDLRDSAMPSSEFRAILLSQMDSALIPDLKDDALAEKVLRQLLALLTWTRSCRQATTVVDYAWRVIVETLAQSSTQFQITAWTKFPELPSLMEQLLLGDDGSLRVQTSRRLYDLCLLDVSIEAQLFGQLKKLLPDPTTHLEAKQHQRFAEFYWLFEQLLTLQLHRNASPEFNKEATELVERCFAGIKSRPVTELSAAYASDQILYGTMRVLSKIVHRWSGEVPAGELIDTMYHTCLFAIKTHTSPLPKCKNPDSRIAAYKLLVRIAQKNPKFQQHIVELLARNHPAQYQQLGTWEYFVGSEDRAPVGYVGIINLGATCYMSSLLQQFYMMPTLRNDLLSSPLAVPLEQDNIAWQLQQMFGFLQESEKMSYNPKEFCASYKDIEGNAVNIAQQQDVNEFFNILCERYESSLKGTDHEKAIAKQFVVTVADEIRSLDQNVPYSSEKDDNFYTIPLDVQHKGSLPEALDLFIKGDKLEGENRVFVERVGRKIEATKRSVLKSLPKTVIFHLKRFEYEVATSRRSKLNHRFTFPFKLNLKPWTKAGVAVAEGRADGFEPRPDDYYEYHLVGVLIHSGSADSGHYYSIVKERTGSKRWLQFNDRIVTEFEQDNIGQETFGGMHQVRSWDSYQRKHVVKEAPLERNAYMLFYERVHHDPSFDLPVEDPEKDKAAAAQNAAASLKASAEADGTLETYSLPGGGNIPPVYDTLLMSIFQADHAKFRSVQESLAASTQSSASNSASKSESKSNFEKPVLIEGVPKQIHDSIWSENATFMKERQVFDTVYFDFLLRLLSDLKFNPVITYDHSKHDADVVSDSFQETLKNDFAFGFIKMATRIVVELISHAKLNLALPWWYAQLRRVFALHVPAGVWFVDYCRRNNVVKEMLLLAPNERTRIEFADTCQVVAKALDAALAEYVPSALKKPAIASSASATSASSPSSNQSVVAPGVAPATNAAPTATQATLAFAEIFIDLLEESRPHWQRFRQFFQATRDIAAISWRQRQYFLEKDLLQLYEDYFMGHPSVKYPNRPRIMDDTHLPDLFEFVDTISILVRGCHNETPGAAPPNQIRDKVLDMPAAGRNAIFSNTFFNSFLEMEYNIPATCDILTFFSYNTVDRSEMILENVLKLFETSAAHKMALYENLFEALLQLQDDLQERRVRKGITSFKYQSVLSNSKAKGLVGIAQKMHDDRNRSSLDVAKFVVKLARDNKQVFIFLSRRQQDLIWLKEFLETKLEEELPGSKITSQQIESDTPSAQALAVNIHGYKDIKIDLTKDNWRASCHYAAIVFVNYMLKESPQQMNADDKLLELTDTNVKLNTELDELKKQKETLIEALRIYQTAVALNVALPPSLAIQVEAILGPARRNGAAGVGGNPASDLALAGVASVRVNDREMTDFSPGAMVVAGGANPTQHQPLNGWVQGQSGNLTNLTNVGGAGDERKENPEAGVQHGPHTQGQQLDHFSGHGHKGNRRHGGHRNYDRDPDWHNSHFSDDDYNDNEQEDLTNRGRRTENWTHMHGGGAGHYKPKEKEPPRDIEERLAQLRMIFEHLDDDTLMVALRHSDNFDPNRAADELFDPSRVEMFQREAKTRREEQAAEARLQAQQQQQGQQQPTQQHPTNGHFGTESDDDIPKHGLVNDSDGEPHSRLNVSSDEN